MKFPAACAMALLVVSLFSVPAQSQTREEREQDRQDRARAERDHEANDRFFENQAILEASIVAMWEEFQADRARAAEYRPRLIVDETEKLAERIERLYSDASSNDLSERNWNARSEDIEDSVDRLTQLVNYGSDPPQINVASLPEEAIDIRVQRLVNISHRLIPNLLYLVGNDLFDLNLLNQVRSDLALTEALSRALPGSQ